MKEHSILRVLITQLKRLLPHARHWPPANPEFPEDPYSYVGAPKKPRLPHLSASASAPLESPDS